MPRRNRRTGSEPPNRPVREAAQPPIRASAACGRPADFGGEKGRLSEPGDGWKRRDTSRVAKQRAATRAAESFADRFSTIVENVEHVIQGKADAVELALVCMLAEGHLLIEDVPGVGKTSLAKALAASIDCTWRRIQFTPDLLPSDVTGVSVYNRATGGFEFRPGGIFANIVLGDEIN